MKPNNLHLPPGLEDVGARVSIRLFEDTGGFRDLLGILEAPTCVRKKSGELIEFAPEKIFLWKKVEA